MPLSFTPMGGWALVDFTLASANDGVDAGSGQYGAYTTGLQDCIPVVIYLMGEDGQPSSRAAFCHMDSQSRLGDLARPILEWIGQGEVGGGQPHVVSTRPDDVRVSQVMLELTQVQGDQAVVDRIDTGGLGDNFGIRAENAEGPAGGPRAWSVVTNAQIDTFLAADAESPEDAVLRLDNANTIGDAFNERVATLGYYSEGVAPALGEREGYVSSMSGQYVTPESNAAWPEANAPGPSGPSGPSGDGSASSGASGQGDGQPDGDEGSGLPDGSEGSGLPDSQGEGPVE